MGHIALTMVVFVTAGISLLKVGGRIVYSTCSMNPVENEAVVAEVMYLLLHVTIYSLVVKCVRLFYHH